MLGPVGRSPRFYSSTILKNQGKSPSNWFFFPKFVFSTKIYPTLDRFSVLRIFHLKKRTQRTNFINFTSSFYHDRSFFVVLFFLPRLVTLNCNIEWLPVDYFLFLNVLRAELSENTVKLLRGEREKIVGRGAKGIVNFFADIDTEFVAIFSQWQRNFRNNVFSFWLKIGKAKGRIGFCTLSVSVFVHFSFNQPKKNNISPLTKVMKFFQNNIEKLIKASKYFSKIISKIWQCLGETWKRSFSFISNYKKYNPKFAQPLFEIYSFMCKIVTHSYESLIPDERERKSKAYDIVKEGSLLRTIHIYTEN